jgi:hypothetical protein
MTKEDFISIILKNVKSGQWINGTFQVENSKVGIKCFGLWVQRIQIDEKPWDSIPEQKTQKALRAELEKQLAEIQQ